MYFKVHEKLHMHVHDHIHIQGVRNVKTGRKGFSK